MNLLTIMIATAIVLLIALVCVGSYAAGEHNRAETLEDRLHHARVKAVTDQLELTANHSRAVRGLMDRIIELTGEKAAHLSSLASVLSAKKPAA